VKAQVFGAEIGGLRRRLLVGGSIRQAPALVEADPDGSYVANASLGYGLAAG
jgi:hypothetical protein